MKRISSEGTKNLFKSKVQGWINEGFKQMAALENQTVSGIKNFVQNRLKDIVNNRTLEFVKNRTKKLLPKIAGQLTNFTTGDTSMIESFIGTNSFFKKLSMEILIVYMYFSCKTCLV